VRVLWVTAADPDPWVEGPVTTATLGDGDDGERGNRNETDRGVTKATITRRLRKWQRELLLHDWKIGVVFGPVPCDEGEEPGRAECFARPEYKEATIYWDPKRVTIESDEDLDDWCKHELTHCHTWKLEQMAEFWAGDDAQKYETVRNVAEDLVTTLEKVFKHIGRNG
jgi:hypothetical protein